MGIAEIRDYFQYFFFATNYGNYRDQHKINIYKNTNNKVILPNLTSRDHPIPNGLLCLLMVTCFVIVTAN